MRALSYAYLEVINISRHSPSDARVTVVRSDILLSWAAFIHEPISARHHSVHARWQVTSLEFHEDTRYMSLCRPSALLSAIPCRVPNLISLFISQYVLNDCSTCSLRARLRGRLIIETTFCVAGRAIGHERDQEGKYPLEGGSERGGEGHGVEPKGGIMESDQQQQFCLKWNSFGNNLATSFSNLFKSESLTDVTLFCEGKFLHTRADARDSLFVFLCSRLVRHCERIPSSRIAGKKCVGKNARIVPRQT